MISTLAITTPVAAAVAGFVYVTMAPRCSFWGAVISRGPRGGRRVALTFDDGPTPGATDRVLDVLRDAGVRATFFVVGSNCQRHPDLLRRIHDERHLVANHSFHHSHYGSFRRRQYWNSEIRRTSDVIQLTLGLRPALFRPPMGVKTWHTTGAAHELGQTIVTWSCRAVDGLPTTSQRILQRFEGVGDGDILLLHDGVEPNARHHDRSATTDALPRLLEMILKRGLTPVRLDELLALRGYL